MKRAAYFCQISSIALLSVMLPAAAHAQTTTTGESEAAAQSGQDQLPGTSPVNAEGEAETTPGDVIVTGSRIPQPNLTTMQPTTTVTSAYLQDRNLTNIADALNEQPGFRGSTTPDGAQGSYGQGVNFLNGLGLGSNRTLVLIDGHRMVTSNVTSLFNDSSYGTQVDLNTVPSILVDRIETVSVGGAPIYGSDAIAGTTNIILKSRYKGLTASLTDGITQEGDDFTWNASVLAGKDFAGGRGNITLSYSHDNVDGAVYNSRGFLRQNVGNQTNPCAGPVSDDCPAGNYVGNLGRPSGITSTNDGRIDTSIGYDTGPNDGIPGSVLATEETIPYLSRGGLIYYAIDASGNYLPGVAGLYQFDRSGGVVPFDPGIAFPGIYASGGDGFRFNDYSQITSALKRDTANAFVSYDFSPAFKFFFEGEYYHSRADQLVTQPTFNAALFGGTSGTVTFDIDSPFLTDSARSTLAALGVASVDISRASSDLADTSGYSTTNLYHAVGGFRGDFQVGRHAFNYEVSGNYGRSEIADTSQDVNAQHFINAVNVARDASGNIVCTTAQTTIDTVNGFAAPGGAPIADPNCVPLNLLGEGVSDPAARAYVVDQHTTKSVLEEYVLNANVGGSLFDVFRNPVSFNVGYEHQNEKGSFTPSQFEQQGLGRAVAIGPLSGQYNLDTVFGEVKAPLITDQNELSFIHLLEIDAAGRYVDNTVNGGFFSWTAGGLFSPIRDITFRGNFTRSFRTPAITELFLPTSNAFDFVDDLCSPSNINSGPAPENRSQNCAAFLAKYPNATPLDAASANVPSQSGGNPNLENEVADAYTFGAIIQPRFLRGFSFTVDYIHINIKHPISNLDVSTIVSACFDNSVFDTSDPANGNAYCSMIHRYGPGEATDAHGDDAAGQVVNDPAHPGVVSGFINGNRVLYEGIQGSMSYTSSLQNLGIAGTFAIGGDVQYTAKRINDITGVAPQRTDGTIGDPTWAGQVNVSYDGQGFGLFSSFNYIGQQLFSRVSRGPDIREFDKLNDYITINPAIYFDIEKRFRFTLSVTNLLNRQGQKINGVLIPSSYSDLLGRRFAANVRVKF